MLPKNFRRKFELSNFFSEFIFKPSIRTPDSGDKTQRSIERRQYLIDCENFDIGVFF